MRRKLSFIPRAEGLERKEMLSVAVAPHALLIKAAAPSVPYAPNNFAPGNCTWYAADQWHKYAPAPGVNWRGDACKWYMNADLQGWQTTLDPTKLVPGSIIVWSGGAPIDGLQRGHVAIVDAKPVAGSNKLLIHEMNWSGLGKITTATLDLKNLTRVVNSKHTEWNLHFVGYILPKRK